MSSPRFGRVLTAMVTPFTPEGEVDLVAVAGLARRLVDDGTDGLVVNGTTGESATTTDDEKSRIIETVVDAVGDRAHVMAGVGTNDTRHTLHLARAAQAAGATALLVVTPYYNKPPQAGILAHFRAVADATELPVVVYDIPGRAGVAIESDTLIAMAQHPRIVAVKDAKGDLWESTRVMAATELQYYAGDDGATLSQVGQGAVGVIGVTTHVAAARYQELVRAAETGDRDRAVELHRSLVPAVDAVMNITQGAIMVKAALAELGYITHAGVRPPLVAATPQQRGAVAAGLAASGLQRAEAAL
ncbi:4-hydroxy-tetrahydrodipicolinate synthase [Agilicoccus flavus]|uniref:4-hydroxy-tetrahydrodipicolinate synthase n=1 Tax=Agilicoccus flavus TaxID=2775968 RepID=UPI001CF6555F|nr:4-hydroxy-tetrahydrodipicolinate synthase [Agilicoccus flavus]